MCALLCQLASKIDLVREYAGAALQSVLAADRLFIPCVPLREDLQGLVTAMRGRRGSACTAAAGAAAADTGAADDDSAAPAAGWGIPSMVFPAAVPLLRMDPFRTAVLTGLTESVGDINESSAKSARNALLAWVGEQRRKDAFRLLKTIAESLLEIAKRKVPRQFGPVMKTASLLLENGAFDFMDPSKSAFAADMLVAARATMLRTREHKRTIAAMHVCCALTAFAQPVSGDALGAVILLLAHAYPVVRKATADKLYSALLQYDIAALPGDADEAVDALSDVLLETPWATGSMRQVTEARDAIYGIVAIDVPAASAADMMRGRAVARQDDDRDELDDYSALVREMHG